MWELMLWISLICSAPLALAILQMWANWATRSTAAFLREQRALHAHGLFPACDSQEHNGVAGAIRRLRADSDYIRRTSSSALFLAGPALAGMVGG